MGDLGRYRRASSRAGHPIVLRRDASAGSTAAALARFRRGPYSRGNPTESAEGRRAAPARRGSNPRLHDLLGQMPTEPSALSNVSLNAQLWLRMTAVRVGQVTELPDIVSSLV